MCSDAPEMAQDAAPVCSDAPEMAQDAAPAYSDAPEMGAVPHAPLDRKSSPGCRGSA